VELGGSRKDCVKEWLARVKECVGFGAVDEDDAGEPNSVEGDADLDEDSSSSSVEVATGLVRRNG